MLIHIQSVAGRKHTIDVEPTSTILSIKQELQPKEGISVTQQRLLFNGQNLNDQATIESSKISAGDVIHMVLSLVAGF